MLRKFSAWLQQSASEQQPPQHRVELATAVLFFEIARADEQVSADELNHKRQFLAAHFQLSHQVLDDLLAEAEQMVGQAVDFAQFTRVLNDNCSHADKQAIVTALWQTAYADGELDAHEEHLIRRIADLLHLSHREFIQAKLAAQPKS